MNKRLELSKAVGQIVNNDKIIIKMYLNHKTNSFGVKTVIFMATNGKIYIASREEGDHHELKIGAWVPDAKEYNKNDITL